MTVVATPKISYSVLEEAALQAFTSSLTGPVVLPGDADYDEVRNVFNAHIDRRPAVIARPLNTNDVVESVRFARATGLPVAVRGGGHSVAGHSVIENGLLIDLSLMKQIAVRLSDRVAVAQPGVRLGELILETEKHHLVTPVGTSSDTGLAGLALGGGYGYLAGKYGLTLDNIVGSEMARPHVSAPEATAFAHRSVPYGLIVNAAWDENGDPDRCIAWARDFAKAMAPHATGGVYVNGASDEPSSSAYGSNLSRLAQIKKTYDPNNVFRHNKNIEPAT